MKLNDEARVELLVAERLLRTWGWCIREPEALSSRDRRLLSAHDALEPETAVDPVDAKPKKKRKQLKRERDEARREVRFVRFILSANRGRVDQAQRDVAAAVEQRNRIAVEAEAGAHELRERIAELEHQLTQGNAFARLITREDIH